MQVGGIGGGTVRAAEYLKSEESAVRFCPTRRRCPVARLCASVGEDDAAPLFPTVEDIEQEGLLFTDLRFEQRVYFIQSGVFSSIGTFESKRDVPFALYCSGHSIGLAELYIPREATATYYIRALTPGRVCSFPAKALRRRLEGLPTPWSQKILACTLTNLSNAAFVQSVVISQPRVYDRIATLLLFMRDLFEREGQDLDEVRLTQGTLATMVATDRVSAARALHKLADDGLVELGYRSVRLTPALVGRNRPEGSHLAFFNPNE